MSYLDNNGRQGRVSGLVIYTILDNRQTCSGPSRLVEMDGYKIVQVDYQVKRQAKSEANRASRTKLRVA